MVMNLTDAGLHTSTEHSCHPSHGLTLLSSSRDPFRLGIPRIYLQQTSSITFTKAGNTWLWWGEGLEVAIPKG